MLIKTKGYKWKNGKWKNKKLWLNAGFTSKKSQGNHLVTWWLNSCDTNPHDIHLFEVKPKCVMKYEYNGFIYGNVAIKDNTIYAYHGEGPFTFTVDFYGTKNSGHEAYTITY